MGASCEGIPAPIRADPFVPVGVHVAHRSNQLGASGGVRLGPAVEGGVLLHFRGVQPGWTTRSVRSFRSIRWFHSVRPARPSRCKDLLPPPSCVAAGDRFDCRVWSVRRVQVSSLRCGENVVPLRTPPRAV